MAGEQLGMVALLHDLPVVDVADLIRILDRGQAVRDDEAREMCIRDSTKASRCSSMRSMNPDRYSLPSMPVASMKTAVSSSISCWA